MTNCAAMAAYPWVEPMKKCPEICCSSAPKLDDGCSCWPPSSTSSQGASSRIAAREPIRPVAVFRRQDGVGHGRTESIACAQDDSAQDRPQRKDTRPEGKSGTQKIRSEEAIAEALVTARHPGERRARSKTRCLYVAGSQANCGFAQAFSGTQFAPQDRRLSLGAFDADFLYQPRRQDLAKNPARPAAARQE